MPSSTDMMDNSHSQTVLCCLNEQRTKGVFCDVTIVVEDAKFKAHKNVLAAASIYFKNLFSSQELWLVGHILELPDFKADVFAEILQFIYSAKVALKGYERVQELVDAGKRLGISFLENLMPIPQQHTEPVTALRSCSPNSTQSVSSASSHSLPTSLPNLKAEDCNARSDKGSEDFHCVNGPRITNAFSIFDMQAGSDMYFPVDLTTNCNKKTTESNKLSMVYVGQDANGTQQIPAHTFAEHSYAVSSSQKDQQNVDPPYDLQVKEAVQENEQPLCNINSNTADSGASQEMQLEDQISKAPQTLYTASSTGFNVLRFNLNALQTANDSSLGIVVPATGPLNGPDVETKETEDGGTDEERTSATENTSKLVSNTVWSETAPAVPCQTPYNCKYCPRSFSTRASLNVHSQIHTTLLEKPLSCRHCGKPFVHLKRLQTHEHLCKGPGTTLSDRESADEQVENICSDNEVASGEDDRNSISHTLEIEHSNKRPLKLVRSRRGNSSPEPEHFVKVVEGHILYFCSVCKRSYVTLSSLKRHANVHSWRRTYPCHYCNKVFALAEYRTKHEIWHTGERRYQCIFCLETFMTYYTLKTHQKSFHGIDPGLPTNKKAASGGYRAKMYPFKLYRLLPMKLQKRPYKTYTRSCPENCKDNKVVGVPSTDENESSLDINNFSVSSSISSTSEHLQDKLLSSEIMPSQESSLCAPGSFLTERSESGARETCLLAECEDGSLSAGCYLNDPLFSCTSTENETYHNDKDDTDNRQQPLATDMNSTAFSVINYGHTAQSVIMHSNRVSSVIKHGNAFSSVITYNHGVQSGNDIYHSLSQTNMSNDPLDTNPRKNISKDCVRFQKKGIYKKGNEQITELAATQKNHSSPFSGGCRTETYIAKPAFPGTSTNSQVAPLCQITVKIGDKAVVQRQITGSKQFRRKGRKPKYMIPNEEKMVQDIKLEECEDQITKSPSYTDPIGSIADSAGGIETCDEMSDHDSNDKLWRPYYSYKPKKRSKGFNKLRKSRWKKNGGCDVDSPSVPIPAISEDQNFDIPKGIALNKEINDVSQESNCTFGDKTKHTEEAKRQRQLKCHSTTKPYSCTICTKLFPNSSTLKMHMRCHTGEQPFSCKSCGRRFSVQGNLHKHERIHLGVKEFVCLYCNKAFTLSETLKKHERIHTGEKRYRCHFCPRRFLYLKTKKNHEQRHLERKRAQQVGKEHVCFQCFKVCKTAAALGMHQKKHLIKHPSCEDTEGSKNYESDLHTNMTCPTVAETKLKNRTEAENKLKLATTTSNCEQNHSSCDTELSPDCGQPHLPTVQTNSAKYPWPSAHDISADPLQRSLPQNSENIWQIHQQNIDINLPICRNISYQCENSNRDDSRIAFYQHSTKMFYSHQGEGMVYKAM
ncbi:zinc finger and BTB domain-containing protein 38 isoform X2 [Stegostoma tigrinum]|nr:zinc finger and BTB domain-containing protein 38 isoform X2 [Stegostoma tigrinum]XP_048397856.1 zinc finger and BTB domain-containing protein 38 isoform X2 [Stegostoma tigrinum]XP_048397858.1 zinc finger and BTB domain-containing protein 38 isoform X2 [Stegostoma tigrinum]XP_048397859.1 zinc finger and BTB domain-containing protein 38 isoform X2 [Stegostoma tigrinum]XP_048397860.1 zinc finger and BTB domain-containing protein 38 isoform X2 [Stegostoma tigrinum]XP_059507222.1 zinc finger and